MRSYILKDCVPVPCDDRSEWGKWSDTADRRVEQTEIDGVFISTVFLGIDHNFIGRGPPILFETMVFGGALDEEQRRYATWDEAVAGHAAMVARVIALGTTAK